MLSLETTPQENLRAVQARIFCFVSCRASTVDDVMMWFCRKLERSSTVPGLAVFFASRV